jgi:Transposase DDE domain group 1
MLIAISKSRRSRRNSVRYPVNAAQPVVNRYQGKVSRIYFRADAAFAMPEVYEFLEAERIKYAIRLPANQVLQGRIGYLLKRPVGRPPNEVRRFPCQFQLSGRKLDQAAPGDRQGRMASGRAISPRWLHCDEHEPPGRARRRQRRTCEEWIKEGKGAIKWTRLSCRTFAANAVRLQLHALAYNLGSRLHLARSCRKAGRVSISTADRQSSGESRVISYSCLR